MKFVCRFRLFRDAVECFGSARDRRRRPAQGALVLVGGQPLQTILSTTTYTGSSYQEVEVAFTASNSSSSLVFTLGENGKNQAIYVDDISLTKTPAAPTGAVGTLVSSLVGIGNGANNVTDPDSNAKTGIAITALSQSETGTWYYSINNGSTWTSIGSVAATSALLLAADAQTRIYFQPNNSLSAGTASVTFEAWDQTSGTNGSTANASINGGATAFSATSETASMAIGTASTSPFTLTTGTDNVFYASGTNAVTGSLNGGSSTLTTSDSLIGGSGVDTLNLSIGSSNTGTFNFGSMAKFTGFDDVVIAANPSQSASLIFTNPNVLSGQTLTVDGSATTTASTHSFTVSAAGVNNGGNFVFIAGNFASNVFSGGTGNNTYEFTNANFTSTNHITGGGNDTIQLTTAASVADSAFTNDSAVEAILLGNFANTLVLDTRANTAFGGAGHVLTIDDSAATGGTFTLTASNNVQENLVVITGGGADHLTGGAGNDTFEFTNAHFHGLATPQTVAGGTGSDTIWITDTAAITVTDADFTHVTAIETLKVGGTGADSITLGSTVSAEIGGAGHVFTVDDSTGSGALTVNASGMVANLLSELNGADFTSADHITGGSGNDTIELVDTAGIVVTDADFTHVSGIETLQFGGSGDVSVTLGASASADVGGAGHTLTVDGSTGTGNLTVDGSAMTANLDILGGSGNDTLIAGSGNDHLTAGSGNDTLKGGAGNDTITAGLGADIFAYGEQGASNFDSIFNFGSNDKIDISALLGSNANSITSGNLANYVDLKISGSDVVLLVDTTGHGSFGSANEVAVLSGAASNQHIVDVVFARLDHQIATHA
jgi:hypothetical protein